MTTIILFPGNDVYAALTAGDIILGVGGDDILTATTGGNQLQGGDGSDTLNGGIGNDYLQGDDLNNFNGHNIMFGDAGDDYIMSNSTLDEVDAGSGDDTVEVWKMDDNQVFKGGAGVDELVLYAQQIGVYELHFSASFTAMQGIVAKYAAFRGFERLEFIGGQFECNISGGALGDTIIINNLSNETFEAGILEGRGGDDNFIISGLTASGTETVDGGTGNDRLSWVQGTLAVTNLTVDAAGGSISGDAGEFLTFTSIESVSISAGNILGHFAFLGSANGDSVTFSGLTASADTGGGDDSISINAINATVNAGAGDDSISTANNVAATVSVSAGGGNDTVSSGSGGTTSGDGGNDTLRTTYNQCSIFGGSGNDVLSRQASFADEASSSGVIDGGDGKDTLTLTFNIIGTPLRFDFSKATETLHDGMTVTGCEIVIYNGGFGIDIVTSSNDSGGAAVNIVNGASGNDRLTASDAGATLDGGFGDDLLKGGLGDDILQGGFNGNDTLNGGGGKDQLSGSVGKDILNGGGGGDLFIFTTWDGSLNAVAMRDIVKDFSRAQGDKIDVKAIDAVLATVGVDEAFKFVGSAFTNKAGQLIAEKFNAAGTANDYTLISGDITGDGVAEFMIEVRGLVDFRASDFIL